MRNFPKINDKFYNAGFESGQRGGTFKKTVEDMVAIEEAAERAASKNIEPPMASDYREVESRTFSRFIGFLDGTLTRLRR